MKTYSVWKGLKKALFAIIVVAVPLIVQVLPTDIANLTISGALLMLVNYLKVVWGE